MEGRGSSREESGEGERETGDEGRDVSSLKTVEYSQICV